MNPRMHDGIPIKPYTLQELAALYGICKTTMRRWLKPHKPAIGVKNGHFYTC